MFLIHLYHKPPIWPGKTRLEFFFLMYHTATHSLQNYFNLKIYEVFSILLLLALVIFYLFTLKE